MNGDVLLLPWPTINQMIKGFLIKSNGCMHGWKVCSNISLCSMLIKSYALASPILEQVLEHMLVLEHFPFLEHLLISWCCPPER